MLEKFPHIGTVIIEDDVEIGSNTCIDRGTLGDTIIGEGVRIDNLVHISHNVEIGRHSAVIANAMVGGGTKIGELSWVAPSSSVRDRLEIGDNSVIGLASVVTKDISPNKTVMGSPAREQSEQKALLKYWKSVIN